MRNLAALCFALAAPSAGAIPQDKLVDPRPKSAVLDATGTLGIADVGTIDSMASRARAEGDLVVVVIDSVSGAVPRTFTTQLFNRWGIDNRQRNRGVMLLVALRDRKAEIVIGDGYPDAVTSVTDRIMSQIVVARFKAGRPRDAIVEGARAIVDQVILRSAAAAVQPAAPPPPPVPAYAAQTAAVAEEPLFVRAMDGAIDNPLPVGGGIGGLVAGGALLRRYLRNRPRQCRQCGTMMARMDEAADDKHLTSGEKAEERVGSVDYDIWACQCGQTMKLRYGSMFSGYGTCEGCQAKTLKVTTTTLVSATTSSEGRARVDESCAHCKYSHSYERSIPRVQERSSSSSSSSSGGSSSGRGSSGSW